MRPLVSVIMATYNRSNILHYAIRCVRFQTVSDWELIVVGDACTDDTEQVVKKFGDTRIRFINLLHNIGEQSGPNNVGLQLAHGQYIAFLNHDDFWFPDHLDSAIRTLQAGRAVFSLSTGIFIQPDESVYTVGIFSNNHYLPNYFVPASGWVFKREVLEVVPGWRSYRKLWIFPSHDFLRRVYRAGLPMVPTNQLTFVLIPSGNRTNSYRDRQEVDHQRYFDELIHNPNWRSDLLLKALRNPDCSTKEGGLSLVWQGVKNILKQPFIRRGIVTIEWRLMMKYPKKAMYCRPYELYEACLNYNDNDSFFQHGSTH